MELHMGLHMEFHMELHMGLHMELYIELHMELRRDLHMELHMELHMGLDMELHMALHGAQFWDDRRSPGMVNCLHQNKIETAIYMRRNPNASRFSGEPETLNATHKTD